MKARLGWRLLGLLLLIALTGWAVQRFRGPPVSTVAVKRQPLTQRVVVSGRVTPPSQIQIGPNLSGTVLTVKVEEGDVVEPGATLLEIEASELEAAVAQAEAQLLQSRARLTQLLKVAAPTQAQAVRQAELAAQQANRQAERSRTLAGAGGMSQQELDQAINEAQLAQSRLASAQAQASATGSGGAEVRAAEANVAQAEAQRAAARARRNNATLTSPVQALVLRRDVEPGDSVSPGRILLVLGRVGATRLSVEPDEKNLAFIQPGQPAVASVEAFPDQRFEARVESVAPAVNPERGTVEVKLQVPQPPPYLRADMTVSVEIEVATRKDAVVIPLEAVQDASTPRPWVLRARDGRAERIPVRLGLGGQGQVEVVEGLSDGDQVLLTPGKIEPGSRIRAREG